MGCCWYHKGTNFQANHNAHLGKLSKSYVVVDTTKVRIFKQITTDEDNTSVSIKLLLIPQRYEFSSKSQQREDNSYIEYSCCWYHKGTNFQANHNKREDNSYIEYVVVDTTKVRIFKQITTIKFSLRPHGSLLLIPQRYEFSSKSQLCASIYLQACRCCWYHKGTNFQANHNKLLAI